MEKNSDGSVISAYDYAVNAIGQRERVDRTGSAFATSDPAQWSYDAFGNEIDSKTTGAKANDFAHRFSTKPLDSETGFYYYGYRYYDPVDGKWPSRDPLADEQFLKDYLSNHNIKGYSNVRKLEGEQMGNIYAMLNNDSLNDYDPLGLQGGKKEVCCGGKKVKIGPRSTCCDGIVKAKKTCNCLRSGGKWVQRRRCPSHWCYDPLVSPQIPGTLAGAQLGAKCGGPLGAIIGEACGAAGGGSICRGYLCCKS